MKYQLPGPYMEMYMQISSVKRPIYCCVEDKLKDIHAKDGHIIHLGLHMGNGPVNR